LFKKERQALILNRLNLCNKVLNINLCEDVDVSEDTIRRDLQELAEAGKLIKVHGGGLSLVFSAIHAGSKTIYCQKKAVIAEKAIGLIRRSMNVLTSAPIST